MIKARIHIKTVFCVLFILAGLVGNVVVRAEIRISDASGKEFALKKDAKRIVTLAPFITELLYAIGAGDRIIGTVEYSDFPVKAKKIPRIGRYNAVDEERIIALAPEIVIAWKTGTPSAIADRLKKMGIPVFLLEPSTLDDVRTSLLILGKITGLRKRADIAADRFQKKLTRLRHQFEQRKRISVFYQIWDKPLMSIGGQQVTSDMLALCRGKNIFSPVKKISFPVSIESVIKENPQVIIVASKGAISRNWVSDWSHWPEIEAVKRGNIYTVNPDYMRHTPRILKGVEQLCTLLDVARKKR